ncbi:MAG: DNA-processing protein DprA [Gammaproteobacteria bacterium]|nr:DNA-processing protein DprA [Gammaproteobacteria bacterium]
MAKAIISASSKSYHSDIHWLKSNPKNHIILSSQANYPKLLKQIYIPPPILYASGDVTLLNGKSFISIVGGRKASSLGKSLAYEFSAQLAESGVSVISGLARGIDKQAHLGALSVKSGTTVAVLANGLDTIYPSEHQELADNIISRGLLLSEFPPGVKPLPQHFPKRNRIISGLSLGTIVIEAAERSGSLITAQSALEQNREVFAVPGPVNNPLNKGCHNLIQQGAKLTTSIGDIFSELPIMNRSNSPTKISTKNHQVKLGEVDKLLCFLEYTPMTIELIIEKSGLTPEQVSSMLTEFEIGGQVVSDAFGHYIRA